MCICQDSFSIFGHNIKGIYIYRKFYFNFIYFLNTFFSFSFFFVSPITDIKPYNNDSDYWGCTKQLTNINIQKISMSFIQFCTTAKSWSIKFKLKYIQALIKIANLRFKFVWYVNTDNNIGDFQRFIDPFYPHCIYWQVLSEPCTLIAVKKKLKIHYFYFLNW